MGNVGYWSGEGFRANGTRTRVVRTLSTALNRFVKSEGVLAHALRSAFWSQLKWGNREPGIIFQKEIACGISHKVKAGSSRLFLSTSVVMRNTCQVTNQSSHGELSFHHNPQLQLAGACASLLLALFGEEAQD